MTFSTAQGLSKDPPLIFISYSHEDEAWKDRLTRQMKPLERQGAFKIWDDAWIPPGSDWQPEIENVMGRAVLAVLLISQNFLSSDFISQVEIPYLLNRRSTGGLKILPVIVHPCAWNKVAWLSKIQCRPKDGKPLSSMARESLIEAALAELAVEISEIVKPSPPPIAEFRASPVTPPPAPLHPSPDRRIKEQPSPSPRREPIPKKESKPPERPAPAETSAKKSASPLTWIAVGCLIIVLATGFLFSIMGYFAKRAIDRVSKNPTMKTAELMVKANPDLELLNADEEHNTLTVKDRKTGEVMTINAEDAKNGKFLIKSDKGSAIVDTSSSNGFNIQATDEKGQKSTATFGGVPKNLPSWVPIYPGGAVQGSFDSTNAEGRTVSFTVTTKDSIGEMLDFFKSRIESAGLKAEKNPYNDKDGQLGGGTVSGKSEEGKREITVLVGIYNGSTQAIISFTEKK